MELVQAKEILSALANGVNPMTGEILPDSDSCNQPSVVRALYTALSALENKVTPLKARKYENSGKPWTPEENDQVVAEYQSGMSGAEIAKLHKRSTTAIAARLVHLGIISERDAIR